MDEQTRKEALEKAEMGGGVECWKFGITTVRIARALLFERSEVERLTKALAAAKPAPVTDEARVRAYDTAKRVLGHEDSWERETLLANGMLGERAEGDRLGSLLDSVVAFASLRAADEPRNVLAELLAFIATHRSAK